MPRVNIRTKQGNVASVRWEGEIPIPDKSLDALEAMIDASVEARGGRDEQRSAFLDSLPRDVMRKLSHHDLRRIWKAAKAALSDTPTPAHPAHSKPGEREGE